MKRRGLRDHALSIAFGALFLGALCGQAVAGYAADADQLRQHGSPVPSFGSFLLSSDFVVDVAENWQSEFLQFSLFIFATIWLVQRGSPESKRPGDEGPGTDADQHTGVHADAASPRWAAASGWRRQIFSNSLLLVMTAIFALSWLAQSLAGVVVYNAENAEHATAAIGWVEYLGSADFWNRTLQNWQSEFLAVGAMIAFSIFLRQRGSSESKPVGAANSESSVEAE